MAILAKFDGLVLREVEERDRAALNAWIEADPGHKGILDADFFLGLDRDGKRDERPQCYALEDQDGEVMFIRLSRVSRVYIQFGSKDSSETRSRNRYALLKGMAFLETQLAMAGAEEWIFESNYLQLRRTAIRHMGFQESPRELRRSIYPPERPRGDDGPVLHEQHISPEVL